MRACCGVNIDPIIPLVTDTEDEMNGLVGACRAATLHAFGALLRLRADIWERMKLVLRLLEISNGIERYKQIYGFTRLRPATSQQSQATLIKLSAVESIILNNGIKCDFHLGPRGIDRSTLGQTTLHRFLGSLAKALIVW